MGFLKRLVEEVIELPGVVVKTVTKEAVAFPARVYEGMEKAGDILAGEDDDA